MDGADSLRARASSMLTPIAKKRIFFIIVVIVCLFSLFSEESRASHVARFRCLRGLIPRNDQAHDRDRQGSAFVLLFLRT